MNGRNKAIADFRQWARDEIDFGAKPIDIYRDLRSAMMSLLDEFRVEHEIPGTRYWEHPESDCRFTTEAGDRFDRADECVELTRAEFIGRSGLHFGYEDRL